MTLNVFNAYYYSYEIGIGNVRELKDEKITLQNYCDPLHKKPPTTM